MQSIGEQAYYCCIAGLFMPSIMLFYALCNPYIALSLYLVDIVRFDLPFAYGLFHISRAITPFTIVDFIGRGVVY